MSPFVDLTSSLRRLWLKRRIRALGTRAMQAMPSSCKRRSHETKSSSDDTSESMTPVWTQMKLYGSRPAKTGEERFTTCPFLLFLLYMYSGWLIIHSQRCNSPSTNQVVLMCSPMKTEQKKNVIGMLTIGADMLRNQLGVMGKNLRKSRKKNKQSWLSSTWKI